MNKLIKWIRFNIPPFSSNFIKRSIRKNISLKQGCFVSNINTFTPEKGSNTWTVFVGIGIPRSLYKTGWTCGYVTINYNGNIIHESLGKSDIVIEDTILNEAERIIKEINNG